MIEALVKITIPAQERMVVIKGETQREIDIYVNGFLDGYLYPDREGKEAFYHYYDGLDGLRFDATIQQVGDEFFSIKQQLQLNDLMELAKAGTISDADHEELMRLIAQELNGTIARAQQKNQIIAEVKND